MTDNIFWVQTIKKLKITWKVTESQLTRLALFQPHSFFKKYHFWSYICCTEDLLIYHWVKILKQPKFDYPQRATGTICDFFFPLPFAIHYIMGSMRRPEIGKHFKSFLSFSRVDTGLRFHSAAERSISPCCKTIVSNLLINVRPHFSIKESQGETFRFTNFIWKVCCSPWLDKCPDAQGRDFF